MTLAEILVVDSNPDVLWHRTFTKTLRRTDMASATPSSQKSVSPRTGHTDTCAEPVELAKFQKLSPPLSD